MPRRASIRHSRLRATSKRPINRAALFSLASVLLLTSPALQAAVDPAVVSAQHLFLGMTLGVLVLGTVLAFANWFTSREPLHLYYTAWLGTLLLRDAAQFLAVHPLVPFTNADTSAAVAGAAVCLNLAATLGFFLVAFELPARQPRMARACRWMLIAFLASGLFSLLGGWETLQWPVSLAFGLLAIVLAGWVVPQAIKRDRAHYVPYALAFLLAWVSGPTLGLRQFGLFNPGDPAHWTTLPITLVCLGLFHVALVMHRRRAEAARRDTEQNLLAASRRVEADLERKVAERTRNLATQVEIRKALENRLQDTLNELRQTLVNQRDFVGMVSHEFQTPLAIIDASCQSLAMLPASAEPDVSRRVVKIRNAVARLSGLLRNFLTGERLDSQALELKRQAVDLADVARHVVDMAGDQPGTTLTAPDAVIVQGDPGLIDIAISNLVGNAAKYARSTAPIEVTVTREGNYGIVTVTDHGVGIAPTDLPRIFERFYRGQNPEASPGVGLGLYLTRRICEMFGGDVHVRSEPGLGSTFRIALPVDDTPHLKDDGLTARPLETK